MFSSKYIVCFEHILPYNSPPTLSSPSCLLLALFVRGTMVMTHLKPAFCTVLRIKSQILHMVYEASCLFIVDHSTPPQPHTVCMATETRRKCLILWTAITDGYEPTKSHLSSPISLFLKGVFLDFLVYPARLTLSFMILFLCC